MSNNPPRRTGSSVRLRRAFEKSRSRAPPRSAMKLSELNALPAEHARAALERCCGSSRWVEAMLAERPFADREALLSAAERAGGGLGGEDWLEAFSHHP